VLHDFVFSDFVLALVFVSVLVFVLIMADLPTQFLHSLFLKNFESASKAAPVLAQELRHFLIGWVFNLVLNGGANLWDFLLGVEGTYSEAREGETRVEF
jgi:uncharacterized membrane protein